MVMHDWSDKYCIKILKSLRAAAGPQTQLVITDNFIPYAASASDSVKHIPGALTTTPPAPLLANKGEANLMAYLADMQMLATVNGSERTILQFDGLLEASGWRTIRVYVDEGFQAQNSKIIGVPA